MAVDLITYEVIRARLDGIVREMEAAVLRTGYSTIVRESHDFSCGITDAAGNVVGQSSHPAHMGAYPESVRGLLGFYSLEDMRDGDAFLANHPYHSGCPHANDMIVLAPVVLDGKVVAFTCSMGHTPDIGGVSAGSRNATARDVFGEGLQIVPVRFMRDRTLVQDTASFVRANSRVPDMMIGDLSAKAGVCFTVGIDRLRDVISTYSLETLQAFFTELGDRTEQRARSEIAKWPDGVTEHETMVDDPTNPDQPIRLHVAVVKEGDHITLDFTGTGDQAAAPINLRPPLIKGMSTHGVLVMSDPNMPNNHGLLRSVDFRFRPGSLIDPIYPGPVGFYSKTLSIVESVVMAALSKASGRPTLAHGSVQSSIVLGNAGTSGRPYVQYELMYAGSRAFDGGDGYTGVGHGFSGTGKFTSVEIVESEFDVQMEEFEILPDTGGAGEHRGGPGYSRQYRMLTGGRLSAGAAKRNATGMDGGESGSNAYVIVRPGTDEEERYPGIVSNVGLSPGDVFRIETAGGGGVGSPKDRSRERVIEDIQDGAVSADAAQEVYGLSAEEARAALDS